MCEERTRSFSTLSSFIVRLMVCIGWKLPRPHVAVELAASLLDSRPGLERSHTSEKHMRRIILAGTLTLAVLVSTGLAAANDV